MTDNKLNVMQQRFVDEMILDPTNQTQAAIKAGYSAKSARRIAVHLMSLPKIQDKIQAEQDERAKRVGVTKDRVLREIAKIAFAQPEKGLTDENGNIQIDMKALEGDRIPGEIIISTTQGKRDSRSVTIKSVKVADKVAALSLLGKHMGMFSEKVEHSGHLSLEQLVESSFTSEEESDAVS